VVVNSPRNPDGHVVPAEQLRAVVEWAGADRITVLFDQVYRGVPGPVVPSVLDLWPQLPAHCAVVDGLSKSHALAGLRLGWALASGPLLDAAIGHASHVVGGTGATTQETALAALSDRTTRQRLGALLAANRTTRPAGWPRYRAWSALPSAAGSSSSRTCADGAPMLDGGSPTCRAGCGRSTASRSSTAPRSGHPGICGSRSRCPRASSGQASTGCAGH
jgi:hypothetical protein